MTGKTPGFDDKAYHDNNRKLNIITVIAVVVSIILTILMYLFFDFIDKRNKRIEFEKEHKENMKPIQERRVRQESFDMFRKLTEEEMKDNNKRCDRHFSVDMNMDVFFESK